MTGATIDIKSIRFSTSPTPTVPEEDEEGEKTVYVQSSGLITFPDYGEADAYTNFSDAFDALGEAGGTIIFQGEFATLKDGTAPHGDVTIRGLEDSEHTLRITAQGNQVVKYGNVTFENLDLSYEKSDGTSAEVYHNAGSHTLTFGKNVTVAPLNDGTADKAFAGAYMSNPTSTNLVFDAEGMSYANVVNMRTTSSITFTGHSNYVFNAGTFTNVYGGNHSSVIDTNATGHGDVKYTFNGGDYSGTGLVTTGNNRAGGRIGNVIFTINGGTFTNDIFFGQYSESSEGITHTNPGAAVIIANCKEISQTATGKLADSTLGIGTPRSYGGHSATEIAIINNAELASTVKVAIDSTATATYQIKANYGKVTPVFEASSTETTSTEAGALLGFSMESDLANAYPYVNGVKLEPTEDGYYTLPEGATTVNFLVLPGDVDSDDTVNIVDIVRIAKYINEMEVDINFVNSDLNGDGYITSDDKNLLRKILLQITIN